MTLSQLKMQWCLCKNECFPWHTLIWKCSNDSVKKQPFLVAQSCLEGSNILIIKCFLWHYLGWKYSNVSVNNNRFSLHYTQ